MKIKIERDTKWDYAFKKVTTKYFVWVIQGKEEKCVTVTEGKDEAISVANQIIASPLELGSEIVYEIEK